MTAIELLLTRNSAPKLEAPAPDGESRQRLFQAALRAPDHARLAPWRFLTIDGEARAQLGELFVQALLQRQPDATVEQQDKVRQQPLRAPLLVVVIARCTPHAKVPEQEQLMSAACAAHAILLAAEAEGFAGVWRTGDNAYDPVIQRGLGLQAQEQLIGYLYLGSRVGAPKPLPEYAVEQYVQSWPLDASGD